MLFANPFNLTGLGLGLFMLLAIGFGFFWVIKLEYFLAGGLLICLLSLFMPSFNSSALLGIIGGSIVWGATELPGQEERVRRGLFPANPRRRPDREDR